MKTFRLAMYNVERNGCFPIQLKTIGFDAYSDAEAYCTKLNKRLKNGNYWKIASF